MATKNKKKKARKSKALSSVAPKFSCTDNLDEIKNSVELVQNPTVVESKLEHEMAQAALKADTDTVDGCHQIQQQNKDSQLTSTTDGASNSASGKKSKKKRAKKTSADSQLQSSVDSKDGCSFEEQVEWCIGQLELGLLRREATKAQKDSNEKNIKTLRSLKVPIPRKRQLMRSLFGDYRLKMTTMPLSEGSSPASKQPSVSVVEKKVAEDCGRFFRVKQSSTKTQNETTGVSSSHSEEPQAFRFDFVLDS